MVGNKTDETVEAYCIREAKEETSLDVEILGIVGMSGYTSIYER